jgi:hypothetical protein
MVIRYVKTAHPNPLLIHYHQFPVIPAVHLKPGNPQPVHDIFSEQESEYPRSHHEKRGKPMVNPKLSPALDQLLAIIRVRVGRTHSIHHQPHLNPPARSFPKRFGYPIGQNSLFIDINLKIDALFGGLDRFQNILKIIITLKIKFFASPWFGQRERMGF